jgi:hypothetical protein
LAGNCTIYYTSDLTLSGTWKGTVHTEGHGQLQPDGSFPFTEIATFRGTAQGCGTDGSFQYANEGVIASDGHGQGRWHIVSGSGSGGLSGVRSGSGTDTFYQPTQVVTDGELLGSISCARSGPKHKNHHHKKHHCKKHHRKKHHRCGDADRDGGCDRPNDP